MAKVIGNNFCDYIALYKPPGQQTEARDSSACFEVSCHVVRKINIFYTFTISCKDNKITMTFDYDNDFF